MTSSGPEQPSTASDPPRPPSPPWYGGVVTGLLGLTAAILLTYTLVDWDWQQRLGGWNYVAAVVLIGVMSVLLRRWRPDRSAA